jgi:hypothetical protein
MSHTVPRIFSIAAIEVDLEYLIRATGLQSCISKRRLNGLENTLAALSIKWRPQIYVPIDPARELRMNAQTARRWLAWADEQQTHDPATLARLSVYASGVVLDEGVAAGWVQLRIISEAQ